MHVHLKEDIFLHFHLGLFRIVVIVIIYTVFVFGKLGFEKLFFKFFFVCSLLKKLINEKCFSVNRKHFSVKKNLTWFLEKCFPFILGGHFSKVVKKLEMSYYLLIISNSILKLLIAIYILF
jgi:hypothetical protein